jgi:hypothetical protein
MEGRIGANHTPGTGDLTVPTPHIAIPVLVIALTAATAAFRDTHAHVAQPVNHCAAAEYHQFDFFAGDWDTFDAGKPDKVVARNTVTPMLGGCALREVYEEPSGHKGESFSTYEAGGHRWHQSWVTNDGQLLLLDGHLEGNRMILTGTENLANGTQRLVRGIWYPFSGAVRETADRSTDGGKTWMPWFDIMFRPHRQY